MVWTIESIKKYLQSCHEIIRAPCPYVNRKTITVQIYGDYPKYASPDGEMITKMLHLPPDKNKLLNKQSAQSVTEHRAEYEIDNKNIYDITLIFIQMSNSTTTPSVLGSWT